MSEMDMTELHTWMASSYDPVGCPEELVTGSDGYPMPGDEQPGNPTVHGSRAIHTNPEPRELLDANKQHGHLCIVV